MVFNLFLVKRSSYYLSRSDTHLKYKIVNKIALFNSTIMKYESSEKFILVKFPMKASNGAIKMWSLGKSVNKHILCLFG